MSLKNGMIHIYTGDGKGKTTAAVGLAVRAAGYGKKIYFLQFLKGRSSGEIESLKKFPCITVKRVNSGQKKFFYEMTPEEKAVLAEECKKAWDLFCEEVLKSDYEIIILDEIMALFNNKIFEPELLIDFLNKRKENQEIILTGRDAPQELYETADYVTEMKMIKHPYEKGIGARKGIEF